MGSTVCCSKSSETSLIAKRKRESIKVNVPTLDIPESKMNEKETLNIDFLEYNFEDHSTNRNSHAEPDVEENIHERLEVE